MKELLALCYIVKNEAVLLDKSIGALYHAVDEINILDNGSYDEVNKIAVKYGANVLCDGNANFDKAKNYYFRMANTKWILALDADEEMQVSDVKKLKTFIAQLPPNIMGVYLPRFEYIGNGKWSEIKILRVLRNIDGIEFEDRAIHSTPSKSFKKVNGEVTEFYAPIHHMDVFYKGRAISKRMRNIEKLTEALLTETSNYQLMNYLALEYAALQKYDKAEEVFRMAMKFSKPTEKLKRAWIYMAQMYYMMGEYQEAKKVMMEIFNIDLRWNETKYNVLAKIEHKLGNIEKAFEFVNLSYQYNKNSPSTMLNIGYLLLSNNNPSYDLWVRKAIELNPYILDERIYQEGEIPCIYIQQSAFLDFASHEYLRMLSL